MRKITFQEAIRETLREELSRDEKVIVLGEDIGSFGGLTGTTIDLIDEFGPNRIIETPISECGFVGAAIGLAIQGFRPVVELGLADVILVAMDQIVNTAAKMNYFYDGKATVPAVFRVWSGFRPSGGPQQSQSNEALFAHVPGLKVVMPSCAHDVKGLLKSSIRDENPVIFFEPKGVYQNIGRVPDEDFLIPLGLADIKRGGSDITIIAIGAMVPITIVAAEYLQKKMGISAEVIDPRTLRPLDTETLISSVSKTGHCVIVHEANTFGGFGAEIAAMLVDLAFDKIKAPIKRIGSLETPVPVSPVLELEVIPSKQRIIDTVCALLKK